MRGMRMGRAWDNSAIHRERWVCSFQRLQPLGRSSQRCLLLHQGEAATADWDLRVRDLRGLAQSAVAQFSMLTPFMMHQLRLLNETLEDQGTPRPLARQKVYPLIAAIAVASAMYSPTSAHAVQHTAGAGEDVLNDGYWSCAHDWREGAVCNNCCRCCVQPLAQAP